MNNFRKQYKLDLFLVIVLLVILFIYYIFVTRFTMDLFRLEMLSYVFDSLARNLLSGNSVVDFSAIEWEAYYINNKFYTYWGPFPAFLRMITFLGSYPMYGLLTRLSCYLASVFSLIYFVFSVKLITEKLPNNISSFIQYLLILGFAFASPLFFLIQNPDSYDEVMLWGLAFSISSLYYILSILEKKAFFKNMFFLSIFSGLTILVRPTFTVPLAIVFCLFLLFEIFDHSIFNSIDRSLKKYILVFTPLLLCFGIQFYYNFSRTGNLYFFCDTSIQYANLYKKDFCKLSKAFDIKRIGTSMKDYFALSKESISNKFPFIKFYLPEYSSSYDHKEVIFPFSFAYTWLMIGFFVFLALFICKKITVLPFLISIAFFLEIAVVSSYEAITHRYMADFLPFFLFVNLFMLNRVFEEKLIYKYKNLFAIYVLYVFMNIPISIISSMTFYEAELKVYTILQNSPKDLNVPEYVISDKQFIERAIEREKITNFFNMIRKK